MPKTVKKSPKTPAKAVVKTIQKVSKVVLETAKTMGGKYSFHPFTEDFPLLYGTEFDEFVQDIQEMGQNDPITLFNGQIVDGRNIYRACRQLNISPRFTTVPNGINERNLKRFIVSRNLRRRHLNPSQKAMILAKLLPMDVSILTRMTRMKSQAYDPSISRLVMDMHYSGKSNEEIAGILNTSHVSPLRCATWTAQNVSAIINHRKKNPNFDAQIENHRGMRELAAEHKVSEGLVKGARQVAIKSTDLAQKVEKGEMSVHKALKTLNGKSSTSVPAGENEKQRMKWVEVLLKNFTSRSRLNWSKIDKRELDAYRRNCQDLMGYLTTEISNVQIEIGRQAYSKK